jgi:hypothetical protein
MCADGISTVKMQCSASSYHTVCQCNDVMHDRYKLTKPKVPLLCPQKPATGTRLQPVQSFPHIITS